DGLTFGSPGLAYAQTVWNGKLDPFQNIVGMHYVMSGSGVAGIFGQIRTQLVDGGADLTAHTPMSELPQKDQVDAAVTHRLGDIYNTTIQSASGPVAVGSRAKASTEGLTVADALRLLDAVQASTADVPGSDRAEVLDAVAELRAAVEKEHPDTGDVVKKVGK